MAGEREDGVAGTAEADDAAVEAVEAVEAEEETVACELRGGV